MGPRIDSNLGQFLCKTIRVVVKIVVPCWVPIIIRQLVFRVPKKGP